MNNIVYLKEPGILYDMLFALKLRFNGERAYVPLRIGSLSYEEYEKEYNKVISKLSDIPESLLPLFYYDNENNIKTAIFTYLNEYIDTTSEKLIENFYESLHDINRLKRVIYKNYFSEDCPNVFDNQPIQKIKNKIFSSCLPDNVKMYVYDFLIFGEDQIDCIIASLRKVEKLCREYYEQNKIDIKDCIKKIGEKQIKSLSDNSSYSFEQNKKIYLSCCSLLFEIKNLAHYDDGSILIIGIHAAKNLINDVSDINVDIYNLGSILNDKKRLKILNLLSEEDMYCVQIAKNIGLKENSTLYHLVIMEREGLITAVKKEPYKRRVYYTINKNYLTAIKKLIDTKFIGEINNGNK